MNDRTDAELRDDIFQYAGDALEMLGNATYSDFLNDRTLRSAIFYMVGVIGEAASRTSATGRHRYPGEHWGRFRRLRNILVHEYHSVKTDEIYEATTEHLPAFIAALQPQVL